MDVMNRLLNIFPVKKHHSQQPKESNRHEDSRAVQLTTQDDWSPPRLQRHHVRLILFHDRDGHGKIPVFDTKQQHCQNEQNKQIKNNVTDKLVDDNLSSNTPQHHSLNTRHSLIRTCTNQSSDSQMLGEMMFGSMPLKLAGNSVKVHYMRTQQQLMLTKLFTAHHRPPPTCRINDLSDSCSLPVDYFCPDNSYSGHNTCNNDQLRVPSLSPESAADIRSRSNSFNRPLLSPSPCASLPPSLNSSYNHDLSCSPNQSWTQGISVPTSSLNSSLTRRLHRARSTSLENAIHLYHRVLKPMDQGTTAVKKGKKFAIGLIFSLSDMNPTDIRLFRNFFFSHFTLISRHLEELREKIEESLTLRRNMTENITEAYDNFVTNLITLYCTQRIKTPIWLSVIQASGSVSGQKMEVCRRFLSEFTSLASELDTKDTKFFLSAILTAVLSFHSAWMFTVSKNGHASSRHDKMASRSLAVLPETHPYNPLWAQLGDLYGAVADPLILTRTIVTGSNTQLIHRLLYILTYFIRCSEIESSFSSSTESRKSVLEESNHDSRAGSAITVTDDVASLHSVHSQSQRLDRPLIKPHPFSFGLNSVSNSLRSLNSCSDCDSKTTYGLDYCLDPLVGNNTIGQFQTVAKDTDDSVTVNGITSQFPKFGTCPSKLARPFSKQSNGFIPRQINGYCGNGYHRNTQPTGSLPLSISHAMLKGTSSADSSDSEPTTDSGQFSDNLASSYNRSKDCTIPSGGHSSLGYSSPSYSIASSCPIGNDHMTLNALSHDKQHRLYQEGYRSVPPTILPNIRLTTDTATHPHNYPPNMPHNSCLVMGLRPPFNSSPVPHSVHPPPLNQSASSPNMLSSRHMSKGSTIVQNKSWTGLPLIEGACDDLDSPLYRSHSNSMNDEEQPMALKIDNVNVEESLSPMCIRTVSSSPSAPFTSDLSSKGMKYARQFRDFMPIDISRCAQAPPTNNKPVIDLHDTSVKRSKMADFGHSLMAGHSDKYLTDFVLHGTSQPFGQFKNTLISDLSSVLKNSIVDMPVQHVCAVVMDTDSMTCRLVVLSKSPKTPDGELSIGSIPSSNAVHEMIQSTSLLSKMQMGLEFCLSHLEDRLMEFNDRSQMLSSAILQKPEAADLSLFLQHLHSTLNTHASDQLFLNALATIHCSNCDTNLSSALQMSFIHSLSTNATISK